MIEPITDAMLDWRSWQEVTRTDRGPGVYAIWRRDDDTLVYVGHTRECWSRLRVHRRTGFQPPAYVIHWRQTRTQIEANLLEYAMIQKWRPVMNRYGYKGRAIRFVAPFIGKRTAA